MIAISHVDDEEAAMIFRRFLLQKLLVDLILIIGIEIIRVHAIQLSIVLDKEGNLNSANLRGEPIDPGKSYFVATNDYLYNGGDRMTFFQPNDGLEVLDYKIRNVLIDHFMKIDTLNPVIDDRFIQLKN